MRKAIVNLIEIYSRETDELQHREFAEDYLVRIIAARSPLQTGVYINIIPPCAGVVYHGASTLIKEKFVFGETEYEPINGFAVPINSLL